MTRPPLVDRLKRHGILVGSTVAVTVRRRRIVGEVTAIGRVMLTVRTEDPDDVEWLAARNWPDGEVTVYEDAVFPLEVPS